MRKLLTVSAAVVASTAILFGASPAFAINPTNVWDDGVLKGTVLVQPSADFAYLNHVYTWDSSTGSSAGSSTTHSVGELVISDGTYNFYPWCDTATDTVTEESGATVIECQAKPVIDNDNTDSAFFTGLEVAPSYRISAADANGIVLARMAFALHNTTAVDITIPTVSVTQNWDECTWGHFVSNLGEADRNVNLAGVDSRWVNSGYFQDDNTTLITDSTTFGVAWAGTEGTLMRDTTQGYINDMCNVEQTEENFVIPANSTIYLAFYGVYSYIPVSAPPSGDTLWSQTSAFMAIFDGPYEGELTAGLPADAYVANWEQAPTPELPNTGAGDMTGFTGGALAIVGLGLVLVAVRRRNA